MALKLLLMPSFFPLLVPKNEETQCNQHVIIDVDDNMLSILVSAI